MSYISVEDFKGGLDRRNDRIAGADGSLWNIVNGHITRGGKVGRAKKFVSKYSVPGTFGLAGVNGQLFVFGSTADPGVPAGVTYQQLRHVDGSTAMTRLLDWQPFDGKIFAAAQFADNQIFEYNDGALVTDWVAGRVRADMGSVNGIASHLAALIDADSEYTATAVGTVLTVTGVANEAFTVTGVATNGGSVNDQTLTIARTQQAVPSTAEALATAAFRFVNGKFSPGFNQISSVIVDGVTITSTAIDYQASAALTAAAVAANINANTSIPDYTAVASGDSVVISAAAGSGSTANGLPVEVNVTGEVIVCTGGFSITGGTSSPGVNRITSVKVNALEILNTAVDWATSNSATATAVAAQINSFVSTPDYVATAASQNVFISAKRTTDTTPLNLVLAITKGGDVSVENAVNLSTTVVAMAGGVSQAPGQPQISTITVGGTFDVGDKFTVTIEKAGIVKKFGYEGSPDPTADVLKTFKSKMHAAAGPVVNFSGVNDAKVWNRDQTATPGAGFINVASQDEGAQKVTAMEVYQGQLAIMARNSIQIWSIDADPDLNVLLQTLPNSGTRARRSALAYGSTDVFYLADSGVRSMKARDSSNAAFVSDVGSPIDTFIQAYAKTLTDDQVERAVAILEPGDDRYWLAMGSRVFVFSFFPSNKISAWSYYEPGIEITDMVRLNDKLYVRAGDTIYLYGGDDGATYPDDNEQIVTVETPFYSGGQSATFKVLEGVDFAMKNTWKIEVLTNPDNEAVSLVLGTQSGISYRKGQMAVFDTSTHFALKFTCSRGGDAGITQFAIHYENPHDAR